MRRSRGKSSKSVKRRRRVRRRRKLGHVLRGLVMEGMGVVALVFLYLTIQATPANQVTQSPVSDSQAPTPTQPAKSIDFTGQYANSWAEYTQKTKSQFRQQSMLGSASWLSR